ncbi:similar to Saccharomyces cerevisiae YIL002C INP51 Phosphatidylinositol 4,5-bisphosphate 5-phosphatase [Maudiozyma barnettii]|uniref:phosphoinositide 5-phosphatase n=1 Tax=Maudiozyma barnettii TaxID=61262 RepID=A0A8H2ZLS8_9SACH|nr:phosphoinositide 5-phosphatase INP51 [Kazachstania barnettii]CAB4256387.1 similar to Saccharomyces cerevisiae YIL002C INP51 Phosphatidylinositol 4,5-bisphosphate 5-phosphatase [Kazachstania barnettii]CAD1784996.1 similar to Saccharomyces cerevisiae YIL002C INP51 Phosphatidylinositol 4,5-bisphosphate 5-phosphatase [Kazachstania barnettii]
MSDFRIYIGRNPRTIVLSYKDYSLAFKRYQTPPGHKSQQYGRPPTVIINTIAKEELLDSSKYYEVTFGIFSGLLGIVTVHNSAYIGVISGVQNVGFPRWTLSNSHVIPSENIYKVLDVDFYSLDSNVFDSWYSDRSEQAYDRMVHEHPCGSLKKLFGDGSFYFSKDFDISNNVKNHTMVHNLEYTIDNQDSMFIWNTPLTSEIVTWRNRLPGDERQAFDSSSLLTFVIRGFCKTILIEDSLNTSSITLISRISTESKQHCLSADGLSEDGKVSNFVETEIVVTTTNFIFSYTQICANIPLYWESVDKQILYGRKVKITKDAVHMQTAFDRHFDNLESKYGIITIVNIVKPRSETQESLGSVYKECADKRGIKMTNLECGSSTLSKTPHKLLYLLKEDLFELGAFAYDIERGVYFGKQTGVLRISAFDSVEKQMLVEKIVSKDIIELATKELNKFDLTSSFVETHDKLWSENAFWMEQIFSKNSKNPSKYLKIYSLLFESKMKLYDPLHFYISRYLKQLKTNFTYERSISIFCGTFNISGKTSKDSIDEWIFPDNSGIVGMADAYIIGFEEVVDLTPGQMLSTDPYAKRYWEQRVLTLINGKSDQKYATVWSSQLGGVLLMFFVKDSDYSKIKHIEADVKKTGFGGMASNKGAVAISFRYNATSFCIVASHLAAGLENVEQRHNDYKTIFKNIRFARGQRIKDHDAVIWMGDFNYRILMNNEDVRHLISLEDYSSLFEKDQLNQQMISGESFPYFHEMPITFPPTYKFDPGTKTYDTSEKMRIPAWTDRILSKGEILTQLSYGYAENVMFSDHRPVYATFEATITVVDEEKKESLFSKIYDKVTRKLAALDEDEKEAFLNGRDIFIEGMDKESLVPKSILSSSQVSDRVRSKKLPPPSSEAKKWWIGNGKQVKVELEVDPGKYMINPNRDPNPFRDSGGQRLFVPRQ